MIIKIKHSFLIVLTLCSVQSYSQNSTFIKNVISHRVKTSNVYLNEEPASIDFAYLKSVCKEIETKIGFEIEHQLDSLQYQYENCYNDSLWVEDHTIFGIFVIPSDSCRKKIQENETLLLDQRWSKRKRKRKIKPFLNQNKNVVYRYSFPFWLNEETCILVSSYSKGRLHSGGCMEIYQWNISLNQFDILERLNCYKS